MIWRNLKLVGFCWTLGKIGTLQFITFLFNFLFLLFFIISDFGVISLRALWSNGPIDWLIDCGFDSRPSHIFLFFFAKRNKKLNRNVMNWRVFNIQISWLFPPRNVLGGRKIIFYNCFRNFLIFLIENCENIFFPQFSI